MEVHNQKETRLNKPYRLSTFLLTLCIACLAILFTACTAQPTVTPLPTQAPATASTFVPPTVASPTVALPTDIETSPTNAGVIELRPNAPTPTFTSEPTRAATQPPTMIAPTTLSSPTPDRGDMGDRPLSAQFVIPPPECTGITPAQTEGPYYKANSPERTSLIETGTDGTIIIVTGYVLTRNCKPIANAWLDFWQADAQGRYDNVGYRMRGHQFTDADGRYVLETVLPGLYPGRTRHIHVKVRAPNGPVLTTQLYFPEDAEHNRSDRIYRPGLLVTWLDTADGRKVAVYNFVLDVE